MSRVVIKEITCDIFELPSKYYLGHCISADYELGAGIAKEFERRYHLKEKLREYGEFEREFPDCILIGDVFNIVTKQRYFQKPAYYTLKQALIKMNLIVNEHSIRYIALPLIGCNMDKLEWHKVKSIIYKVFENTECEILICHKPK